MRNTIGKIIATFFGAGYSPIAPGTVGAIFAFLLSWVLYNSVDNSLFILIHCVLFIVSLFTGIWSTNIVMKEWGKDPSRVVIDEAHGFWTAVLFISPSLTNLLVALVLFRFYDILKPLGIRYFDKMDSALGVMLDDSLAGIYAGISSWVLISFVF